MELSHSFVLNEIFKNRLVAILRRVPEEKLGFTGEGLGIAAHAVCLLVKNK